MISFSQKIILIGVYPMNFSNLQPYFKAINLSEKVLQELIDGEEKFNYTEVTYHEFLNQIQENPITKESFLSTLYKTAEASQKLFVNLASLSVKIARSIYISGNPQKPIRWQIYSFQILRNIEEILGHLLSLFLAEKGTYLVQDSLFHQECYHQKIYHPRVQKEDVEDIVVHIDTFSNSKENSSHGYLIPNFHREENVNDPYEYNQALVIKASEFSQNPPLGKIMENLFVSHRFVPNECHWQCDPTNGATFFLRIPKEISVEFLTWNNNNIPEKAIRSMPWTDAEKQWLNQK